LNYGGIVEQMATQKEEEGTGLTKVNSEKDQDAGDECNNLRKFAEISNEDTLNTNNPEDTPNPLKRALKNDLSKDTEKDINITKMPKTQKCLITDLNLPSLEGYDLVLKNEISELLCE
jgi:hypothetical protein